MKGDFIVDTMFQWFYDILALTISAVLIYSSAKKGFSKTIPVMVGYVLSIFIASMVSSPMANAFYSNVIKKNNVSAISENLSDLNFTQKYKSYIDALGYNIKTDSEKLEIIFTSDNDITESVYQYCCELNGSNIPKDSFSEKFQSGYADIVYEALKSDLPVYTLQSLYDSPADFNQNIKAMYNSDPLEIGRYIEENYVKSPIISVVKSVCFIISVFIVMFLVRIIADKINNAQLIKRFGFADRILGSILGLAEALIILAIIAVFVKSLILISNDEMMLFNSETIEKTKIFKHIFNFKYID